MKNISLRRMQCLALAVLVFFAAPSARAAGAVMASPDAATEMDREFLALSSTLRSGRAPDAGQKKAISGFISKYGSRVRTNPYLVELAPFLSRDVMPEDDLMALAFLLWSFQETSPAGTLFAGMDDGKNVLAAIYHARWLCEGKGDCQQSTAGGKILSRRMPELVRLAEGGDPRAQQALGDLYRLGMGTVKDPAQSARWYKTGAAQSYTVSQTALALSYCDGFGVRRDTATCITILSSAAAAGYAPAQMALGVRYYHGAAVEQDYRQAAIWLGKAARQGMPQAQYLAGMMAEDGRGQEQDFAKAAGFYVRAWTHGHMGAAGRLGMLYMEGAGVPVDSERGLRLLREASAGGDAFAGFALGLCYYEGKGVDKDVPEAARWFARAGDAGSTEGNYNLGSLLWQGTEIPRDRKAAVPRFRAAAETGSAPAQASLAQAYLTGDGIEKNADEAYIWASIAVQYGMDAAAEIKDKAAEEITFEKLGRDNVDVYLRAGRIRASGQP